MHGPNSFDVVIAGAGPVGLFLACELAVAGCSIVVLERETTGPEDDPWKMGPLGIRGLNNPSVESFYRRGLLEQILPLADPLFRIEQSRFAGHFAGIFLDTNKVDFPRWKHVLPGPSVSGGPTHQGKVMSILIKRALSLGVTILRGREVARVEDTATNIKVYTVGHGEGSGSGSEAPANEESFTAQYLVGADGGRSNVRRLGNFDFIGSEATWTGYAVNCNLEDPELLSYGFIHTKNGMYIRARPEIWGGEAYYAMDFDLSFDRTQPVTEAHYQKVLRRVSGKDVVVKKIHLAGTFTDRTKQATEYRRGRILLVGDAAHIHAPLGGQGLNLGLGDATNLGWKLAAVVKGHAAEGLLDSYHTERHPFGKQVLEHTRAQTAAIAPGLHGEALFNLFKELSETKDGVTHLAGKFNWYGRQINLEDKADAHWLLGKSAPDFEFEDGTRLGKKMEGARWVVVDFGKSAAVKGLAGKLEGLAEYVDMSANESFDTKTLLVRPDGVIAWVTEQEGEVESLKAAWRRWVRHPALEQ